MPTLLSSGSTPRGLPPQSPQLHLFTPLIRPARKRFFTNLLAIGALLAILLFGLGCANSVPAVSLLTPVPPPANPGPEAATSSDQQAARPAQPGPHRAIFAAARSGESMPLARTSFHNASLAPEPGVTLAPQANPTRIVMVTSTAVPVPLPTATSLPTPMAAPLASLPPIIPTPVVTGQAGIKHVVIISIDGLRPDAIDVADTPNLDRLIAQGTYNPRAQTLVTSRTLPGHASMLTGVVEQKHGLIWGEPFIGWPGINGPTLLSLAHDAGFSTGIVSGKEKLNYLVLPNSVDKAWVFDGGDTEVKDKAVEFIQAGLPDLLFIHFPDTDRVGHAYGWMSENQLYAITFADSMVGQVVAALELGGYLSNTLIIINSDHGGHGRNHGDDSPDDRTIPWLAVGPGVPQGVILYSLINIYDTPATAMYALKLPLPEGWDGRPVMEIFP